MPRSKKDRLLTIPYHPALLYRQATQVNDRAYQLRNKGFLPWLAYLHTHSSGPILKY